MARDKTIKLYRRIGGVAGAPGALLEGEPGYNDNGNTLDIGGAGGASVHRLVGANRQLELTGPQTIGAGAGNAKTWEVANFKLLGGANGNVLSRGANDGDVVWTAAPSVAVATNTSLTGNGLVGTELGVVFADNTAIDAGTNTTSAINSAGLRHVSGNLTTLNTTDKTNLTAAINEVLGQVLGLATAIQWVGSYDGVNVTGAAGGPMAAGGALPAPAAGNRGWTVIMTAAVATPAAPMPSTPLAVGDWLISPGTGTTWVHIPLHHPATAAANVTVTTIGTGSTATHVQGALEELHTAVTNLTTNALTSINVDNVSIIGSGLAGAGNALRVDVIDGGTF